jgi:hypothetical protein
MFAVELSWERMVGLTHSLLTGPLSLESGELVLVCNLSCQMDGMESIDVNNQFRKRREREPGT